MSIHGYGWHWMCFWDLNSIILNLNWPNSGFQWCLVNWIFIVCVIWFYSITNDSINFSKFFKNIWMFLFIPWNGLNEFQFGFGPLFIVLHSNMNCTYTCVAAAFEDKRLNIQRWSKYFYFGVMKSYLIHFIQLRFKLVNGSLFGYWLMFWTISFQYTLGKWRSLIHFQTTLLLFLIWFQWKSPNTFSWKIIDFLLCCLCLLLIRAHIHIHLSIKTSSSVNTYISTLIGTAA